MAVVVVLISLSPHCWEEQVGWERPAGGYAVSSEYTPKFEWSDGEIIKVVYDVADDAYIDVERHLAAAIARD